MIKVLYRDPYQNEYTLDIDNPHKHFYHYSGKLIHFKKGFHENFVLDSTLGSTFLVAKNVCIIL
jgi:hypothetical protein